MTAATEQVGGTGACMQSAILNGGLRIGKPPYRGEGVQLPVMGSRTRPLKLIAGVLRDPVLSYLDVIPLSVSCSSCSRSISSSDGLNPIERNIGPMSVTFTTPSSSLSNNENTSSVPAHIRICTYRPTVGLAHLNYMRHAPVYRPTDL